MGKGKGRIEGFERVERVEMRGSVEVRILCQTLQPAESLGSSRAKNLENSVAPD
jgi:hypothetical protein